MNSPHELYQVFRSHKQCGERLIGRAEIHVSDQKKAAEAEALHLQLVNQLQMLKGITSKLAPFLCNPRPPPSSKEAKSCINQSCLWAELGQLLESDRYDVSVSLGRRMSRAKYSLPNPYHMQNLMRSMVERLGLLEEDHNIDEERSK